MAWVWHKYVPENPAESPYVNEAELAHINEGRTDAVSYTHLVPRLGSTAARLKLKGIDGGPHKRWSMWSVSYTHLDVYKRQQ